MDEEKDIVPEVITESPSEVPSDEPLQLSDSDMLALERASTKRQLTLGDAKNATLVAEASDLLYRNLILQLFLKYGLSMEDSLTADGQIKRKSKV